MAGLLASLAAVVAGGLADELLGRFLPLFLRLPLFAVVTLLAYRRVYPYIKELREDIGR